MSGNYYYLFPCCNSWVACTGRHIAQNGWASDGWIVDVEFTESCRCFNDPLLRKYDPHMPIKKGKVKNRYIPRYFVNAKYYRRNDEGGVELYPVASAYFRLKGITDIPL